MALRIVKRHYGTRMDVEARESLLARWPGDLANTTLIVLFSKPLPLWTMSIDEKKMVYHHEDDGWFQKNWVRAPVFDPRDWAKTQYRGEREPETAFARGGFQLTG